ncbi:MAG: 1-acyl-sn-glycerol-3-phosphate acyltransferase, partial [Planctomycetia bacterium]
MNRQPFGAPPRHWPPRCLPPWVYLVRRRRLRTLERDQRFVDIQIENLDAVRRLLDQRSGVLVAPNHSFHYDSYLLLEAGCRVGRPFFFLTAWQVFAAASRFDRWSLQAHGCFSIDRETNDLHAFRTSVEVLRDRLNPLVVFPEGDVYHSNDVVRGFRDGAAAIALAAARKSDRPVHLLPCALKCWYVGDPLPSLLQTLERLERRLWWRPRPDLTPVERVLRLASGLLSLK